MLKGRDIPFELTDNPAGKDYILRIALEKSLDISDGGLLTEKIKSISNELLMFVETLQL